MQENQLLSQLPIPNTVPAKVEETTVLWTVQTVKDSIKELNLRATSQLKEEG